MKTILSLLIFVVLTIWIGQIYLSNKKKFRAVKYGKGDYYLPELRKRKLELVEVEPTM